VAFLPYCRLEHASGENPLEGLLASAEERAALLVLCSLICSGEHVFQERISPFTDDAPEIRASDFSPTPHLDWAGWVSNSQISSPGWDSRPQAAGLQGQPGQQ
jgi:hypothetical protein